MQKGLYFGVGASPPMSSDLSPGLLLRERSCGGIRASPVTSCTAPASSSRIGKWAPSGMQVSRLVMPARHSINLP
jgi:hypothetical protein